MYFANYCALVILCYYDEEKRKINAEKYEKYDKFQTVF